MGDCDVLLCWAHHTAKNQDLKLQVMGRLDYFSLVDNNSSYHIPGIILSALHGLSDLILITTFSGEWRLLLLFFEDSFDGTVEVREAIIILEGWQKCLWRDFPGGSVVKNLPANSRDMGSIPGPQTNIPPAMGLLSSWATATEVHTP